MVRGRPATKSKLDEPDAPEPAVDDLHARILACVEAIPPGRVMTYGDIAEYVGANTPRLVGHVLRVDGGTVPWHRVLKSDGTFAPHLADEQRQLLIADGVFQVRGRIPLALYRWDGR